MLGGTVLVMAEPRTLTQSIETDVAPEVVVALLADPKRLQDWAPAFADAVSGDAHTGWRAIKDGREFSLRVPVNETACTVDYLREIAPGREGGAYLRAVPRPGGGTVIIMTLPLPPDANPQTLAVTLTAELIAIEDLARTR
jgi:hypothetical protein